MLALLAVAAAAAPGPAAAPDATLGGAGSRTVGAVAARVPPTDPAPAPGGQGWRDVGLTWTLAGTGPAGPTDPAPAPGGQGWRDVGLTWTLAGTGPAGRSLVVRPGTYGGCQQGPPRIVVVETRRAIRVAAFVREPVATDVVCTVIAHVPPLRRVALRAPIAGRAIAGPLRRRAPGAAFEGLLDVAPRLPRVVGLRAADARDALCAWRARARPARGTVVGQSPKVGTPIRIPRTAAPERCDELTDGPVVTVRTR